MKAERVAQMNRSASSSTRLFEPDPEEVEALAAAARRRRDSPVEGLTEMEAEIWVSVEREGMTPAELAEFPDLPSASAIRTHLQRAREKRGNQS